MKRLLAALALVVLAAFLAVALLENDGHEALERPGEAAAEDPRPSEPAPALTEEPPAIPEVDPSSQQVIVTTNVAGATVTLTIRLVGGAPDPAPLTATTDGEGTATFVLPEMPGPIDLMIAEAKAPDGRAAWEYVKDGVANLTLVARGVPVRGRVVNSLDAPVHRAFIEIGSQIRGASGIDGTFEFFVAEAGPVELGVRHDAHCNTTVRIEAPAENVKIVLERGLTISGRVSFPDGKPVPGVRLYTRYPDTHAVTDEDGRYVLAGFEPGRALIDCSCLSFEHGAEVGASDVDLVVMTHVVRMRFVDEEGRPFRHASLWVRAYLNGKDLMTAASSTGEEGLYQLDRVQTGVELRISPSAPGHEEKITTVQIDGEPRLHEVEIIITRPGPTGILELRVLDGMGDPRSQASVSLSNEAGSPVSGFYRKMIELDETGLGRLDVPPGRYQLDIADSTAIASIEGYAMTSTREIEVIAGTTLPVEAVVHTGGRIRVTVKDPDGELAAARRLRLLDGEGEQLTVYFIRVLEGGWTTALDEPGPALLGNPVPSGRYRVRVVREDQSVVEREVDVTAGRTTEVEIQLPRR